MGRGSQQKIGLDIPVRSLQRDAGPILQQVGENLVTAAKGAGTDDS